MAKRSIEVLSLCPLRAGSLVYRDARAAHVVAVVVKGTFDLHAGEARLASEQEDIGEDDNYWNDDPTRSLYCPTDLVPFKARVDVMLVGHAFAPPGERVRMLTTRLAVGTVDKSIQILGDRFVAPDGAVHEGSPFAKMPLRYERAAGGPEAANPVGVHAHVNGEKGRVMLPNLVRSKGDAPNGHDDATATTGFGPIAPSWPERRKRLGRRADSWPIPGWEEMPLPVDVEAAYFNAAPLDQQIDALRDDQEITLEGLHPREARFHTRLPGVRPRAYFQNHPFLPPAEIDLVADTLWIDTDRSIATVTWRGRLDAGDPRAIGRVLVAMEGASRKLAWSDVEKRCRDLGIGPFTGSPPSEAMPQPPMTQVRNPPRVGSGDSAYTFEETSLSMPAGGGLNENQIAAIAADLGSSTETFDLDPIAEPQEPNGGRYPGLPRVGPLEPHDPADDTLVARMRRPPAPQKPVDVSVVSAKPVETGAKITDTMSSTPQAPARSTDPLRGKSMPGMVRMLGVEPPAVPIPPGRTPTAPPPTPLVATPAPAPPRPSPRKEAQPPSAHRRATAKVTSESRRGPAAARDRDAKPGRELIDLVWADPAVDEKIAAQPALALLAKDGVAPNALAVLTRGKRVEADSLTALFAASVSEEGAYTPPSIVVGGGIHFPFAELDTLRAMLVALAPLDPDDALTTLGERGRRLLDSPGAFNASPIAEGIIAQIEDAIAETTLSLPVGYLERTTERILLEERRYQRRRVLGGTFIRALLVPAGATTPIPVYLPDAVADLLPMFKSFKAVLIVEVVCQQDQHEESGVAFKAIALGRALPVPGPRPQS